MTINHEHLREVAELYISTTAPYIDLEAKEVIELLDEIAALRKENEGLRVDAERYRWLRDSTDSRADDAIIERHWEESWLLCGQGLDWAIYSLSHSGANVFFDAGRFLIDAPDGTTLTVTSLRELLYLDRCGRNVSHE